MYKKPILILSLFAILLVPITFQDSDALRQVAGKIIVDIKPGGTSEFEWGLASDNSNQVTRVELSVEGDGGEFLTFEKTLDIDPMKTVITTVQVTIPEDYPGGIEFTPHLIATESGETGGATVINIRMLKIVELNIDQNDDPNLWVDWDALRMDEEPVEFETQTEKTTQQGGMTILQGEKPEETSNEGGGCLIATATYGSELAPQVQQLRELRDNQLLNTESGASFMESFNDFYYSFSPVIADYERENPVFREAVKITITPMISSLSILNYVDMDSEYEVLGYGISLILLNVGMYFVAPVLIIQQIKKRIY